MLKISHLFSPQHQPTAQALAAHHGQVLDNLDTVIAHPRSLARDLPTWRPPTIPLPEFEAIPTLHATVHRKRVGRQTQQFLHTHCDAAHAAYVITVRITDPTGTPVRQEHADAWIQALLLDDTDYDVHQILQESAPTYCWITDGRLRPLPSPATLFSTSYAA